LIKKYCNPESRHFSAHNSHWSRPCSISSPSTVGMSDNLPCNLCIQPNQFLIIHTSNPANGGNKVLRNISIWASMMKKYQTCLILDM
jgi:hypothetical protein